MLETIVKTAICAVWRIFKLIAETRILICALYLATTVGKLNLLITATHIVIV